MSERVSVRGPVGDWSIFRREIVFGENNVGRKHGPVPFTRRKGDQSHFRGDNAGWRRNIHGAAKIGTVPCERLRIKHRVSFPFLTGLLQIGVSCPLSLREGVRVRADWPKNAFFCSPVFPEPSPLAPRPKREGTDLQKSSSDSHLRQVQAWAVEAPSPPASGPRRLVSLKV